MTTSRTLWWAAWPGLGGMVLLGSSVAVIASTQHLPVLGLQSARYAVAALTLVALARVLRVPLPVPRGADVARVAVGAACGLVGFNLLTILGTRHAEPALIGAAVACIPIVLAVAGPLGQGRRPSARVVAGAVVVAAGALLVTGWGRGDAVGIAAAALLVAVEAAFTLVGAQALPRLGAWGWSAWTCATAAAVFAALSAALERPSLAEFARPEAVAAILWLGAMATAVSFVLWFTGVRRLGAATAGLCAGIAAPAAALVAAALGAPLPAAGAWLGMAVVAAGLVIGFRPPAIAPGRAAAALPGR